MTSRQRKRVKRYREEQRSRDRLSERVLATGHVEPAGASIVRVLGLDRLGVTLPGQPGATKFRWSVDDVPDKPASWRWEESCLHAESAGPGGEVVGHFENENGRFKAVRTGSGVSIVPDDLPPNVDGC